MFGKVKTFYAPFAIVACLQFVVFYLLSYFLAVTFVSVLFMLAVLLAVGRVFALFTIGSGGLRLLFTRLRASGF